MPRRARGSGIDRTAEIQPGCVVKLES
jgi:hypothetical protein